MVLVCVDRFHGMYVKEFETFKPMCLPILLCNHRPKIDIADPAMMRRIVVVPFNIYTLPDDPKRPTISITAFGTQN